MTKEQLNKIYLTYGFEIANEEEANIGIYVYKRSRYFGVDVVPLLKDEATIGKSTEIMENYSKLGFASEVKVFSNIHQAEKELYKSFFSYDATIRRLKKKYEDFEDKQTRNLLGSKYEYVDTPFEEFPLSIEDSAKKNLIKKVDELFISTRPQLIIIEAAAGYGKTCAAYEILKLLTYEDKDCTPIFTELARNRVAKIFRYILLDEIDIEFPTLNSDLVIHEIKKGRIPLIIDGFDELLDKVSLDEYKDPQFDEIETMLDTIGALLEDQSKIVLTTRKTAIFSGLEFDKWYVKWNDKFDVTRLSLKEPRIKDWLGNDRLELIKDNNIPIQYIANPVLLTFLKNVDLEEFSLLMLNPEYLVEQYFDRMLEREKERQQLIITVEKQYEIFKNVVKLLLDFDITVESKEFFKEIIKDQNIRLLDYTRTLYNAQERPSVDNLVDTLATHALLDRKGRDESQIGFINDFIIGIFIGEIICEAQTDKIEKDYSQYMLDLACTAYKVQSRRKKEILWAKIMTVSGKFNLESIFTYDIILQEKLMRSYEEITINEFTFFNISFDNESIKSSVFLKCYFKGCKFDVSYFHSVSFVECVFDNCKALEDKLLSNTSEVSTISCKEISCHILADVTYKLEGEDISLEKELLSNLWTVSLTKRPHFNQLMESFDKDKVKKKKIMRALEALSTQKFIEVRGSHIYFNPNRIDDIRILTGH